MSLDAYGLAQELDYIDRLLAGMERKAQLAGSSFEDGAIFNYDRYGNLRQIIGQQPDGRYTITDHNGPKPPAPGAFTVQPMHGITAVVWDGTFSDVIHTDDHGLYYPAARPTDVLFVEVHAGETDDYEPSPLTRVGTINSRLGGRAVCMIGSDVEWWITLVAVTTSYARSDPSAYAPVTPLRAPVSLFHQVTHVVGPRTNTHVVPLAFLPVGHSEHVYWNGIYQEGDRWSRTAHVVSLPDDDLLMWPGDKITVEYAHEGAEVA